MRPRLEFEGIFKDSKLTSKRCDFCHEFLIEDEDDLDHYICKKCWRVIMRKFVIKEMRDEVEDKQ